MKPIEKWHLEYVYGKALGWVPFKWKQKSTENEKLSSSEWRHYYYYGKPTT